MSRAVDIGDTISRWNPIPSPKIPQAAASATPAGPTEAQLRAQATQERVIAAQEQQLQREDAALTKQEETTAASRRARAARLSGRSLLMLDEVGIPAAGGQPIQNRLGA
jgi:hypothetical protein